MFWASFGGLVVAALGVTLWVAISSQLTERVGFMTVVVGVAIGLTVRKFGESRNENFGALATLITFAASIAAELLSGLVQAALATHRDPWIFAQTVTLEHLLNLFRGKFIFLDALFYTLSLFGAYHLAIHNNDTR